MKKNLILIAAMLMLVSAPAFSQLTFGVAPGLNLNSAYFGYKTGKAVPFVGIQFMGISFKNVATGTEWDYDAGAPTDFEDEIKVKGSIFMPTLGLKYFAVEKNKVKGYLIAAIAKPMLNAKMTYNGEENEGINETLDKISLWGGMVGVGAEYFFDDNFSVGGEFGLQVITGKYDDEFTDTYWNPSTSTYVEADFTETANVSLMPTYSKISLNFYF